MKKFLKILLGLVKLILFSLAAVILVPCWLIFKFISNIVPGKTIELANKREVRVPVVHFENSEMNRHVVFVGVMHVADPGYYSRIQEIVDGLDQRGYAVLYELVKHSPDEERELSDAEQELLERVGVFKKLLSFVVEVLLLESQKERLVYKDHWINTDVSRNEMLAWMVEHRITNLPKPSLFTDDEFEDISESDKAFARWAINRVLINFKHILRLHALADFLIPRIGNLKKYILHHRNKVGFDGIIQHVEKRNVVTIWGAAHLPGIERMLKSSGFKEVRREWITVYTDQDHRFKTFLQEIFEDNYPDEHEESKRRREANQSS